MKIISLALLLVLLAATTMASFNWSAFTIATPLSLGVMEVEAPLGVIMLALLLLATTLFLVSFAYLQTARLLELRRANQDIQSARELAAQAESSRLEELGNRLEAMKKEQQELSKQRQEELNEKLSELEKGLHQAIVHSENTLTAYLGELEDRLERGESKELKALPSP